MNEGPCDFFMGFIVERGGGTARSPASRPPSEKFQHRLLECIENAANTNQVVIISLTEFVVDGL